MMVRGLQALILNHAPSLRRLAEEASVGIAVLSAPDWRFTYANAAFHRVSGGPVIGRTLEEVFPGWAPNPVDLLDAPISTGKIVSQQAFPIVSRDDEAATWWDFDDIPLQDDNATPGALLIIAREVSDDVTARREAERARAALLENEERLRLVVDAGRIFCWDWHIATGRVIWSGGLEAALNMPEGTFDGTLESFRAMIHPDDLNHVLMCLDRAICGLEDYDVQFRMFRADGTIRWCTAKGNVLRDGSGQAVRMVGVNLDITTQKNAEEVLRHNEAAWRELPDDAPVGVAIVSSDLRYRNLNRWLAEVTGLPAGDHAARQLRDLVGGLGTHMEVNTRRVLDTGTPVENIGLSGPLPARPCTYGRWRGAGFPIVGQQGAIVGVRQVAVDAALQARADDAAQSPLAPAAQQSHGDKAQRLAAETAMAQSRKLELIGQLATGVAHDFNNLLAMISGSLEMLEARITDNRLLRLVQIGRTASNRAAVLVRQLLAFAHRRDLNPEVIRPQALLEETTELLAQALSGNIDVRLDIAPDTWPVLTDASQLQSALINLAVNARDAMPGGGPLTITMRNLPAGSGAPIVTIGGATLAAGDYVSIAVTDSGTGMTEAVMARVMEPFFTTKPAGEGTGLGLPMANEFSRQANGGLQLVSAAGQGTTVTLILPRSPVELDDGDPAGPAFPEPATILLVADDHLLRPVLAAMLRDFGHDVLEAENAEATVSAALRDPPPDLVIADLDLADIPTPDEPGANPVQRLRAAMPAVPLLLITGDPATVVDAGALVLQKPFSRAKFGQAMLRALYREKMHAAT